jgi:hypothetical protein
LGLGCWSATNDLGQQLRPIHGNFGFDEPASLRPSYLMRRPARGLEQFCGELTTISVYDALEISSRVSALSKIQ